MANSNNPQNAPSRGGDHASHEQHVKAGQQSHKNNDTSNTVSSDGNRGGSSEQHAKAGSQSHKNK